MAVAPRSLQQRIVEATADRPDLFFVQIGANDGLQGDPIHDLIVANAAWRGLFVEPVRFVFERLQRNYQYDARFVFENVAIGGANGRQKFWYLSGALRAAAATDPRVRPLPFWFDQLGSFDRRHILKHFPGREQAIEPFIVEEDVLVMPLGDVLARHRVERVDFMHVDTEGFDYQVLRQIDFARFRPRLILYEHQHLSAADQEAARQLLGAQGYECASLGPDTLATRGAASRGGNAVGKSS